MKIIILLAAMMVSPIIAQNNLKPLLEEIEQNNTTLRTLREEVETLKLQNKTGIFLDNPEVEFNYLFGSPGNIGNRTDFRVTQSFDISVVLGKESSLATKKNNLVELEYKSQRIELLLQAKQLLIDYSIANKWVKELEIRSSHASSIAKSYELKLEKGDASIIEFNKAMLNNRTAKAELDKANIEKNSLLMEIKRLNGGNNLIIEDDIFDNQTLGESFESWFSLAQQKNPIIAYVSEQIEVRKKEVTISKMKNLPQLTTGYMQEKVVGQSYRGVTVGVSIPIWENKNAVRFSKAALKAAHAKKEETTQLYYSYLKNLFNKTLELSLVASDYEKSLKDFSNILLLEKALAAGEISLIDYLTELSLHYKAIESWIQSERDFQKSLAELTSFEL